MCLTTRPSPACTRTNVFPTLGPSAANGHGPPRRLGQKDRDKIEHDGDEKTDGKERVDPGAAGRRPEGHRRVLPSDLVFQKDLDVPADSFNADVQAEHGLENCREHEQR